MVVFAAVVTFSSVAALQDQERELLQQGYGMLQVLETERVADLLKAGAHQLTAGGVGPSSRPNTPCLCLVHLPAYASYVPAAGWLQTPAGH
jgi:hypothetical protein